MRFFNTAGPVNGKDHYCLAPLSRFDQEDILSLIAQKKYFVLHAPRQTGKTSCLLALMEYLNKGDKYKCLYFNVEAAQAARENVNDAMKTILSEMASNAKDYLDDLFFDDKISPILEKQGAHAAFSRILNDWSRESSKPIVLLIDEVDSLVGDTLISLLRQIRTGYTKRPEFFPQSIVLCGVRDIRDYRMHSSKEKEIITGGSAFNIKAKSLRLGDFSKIEINELLNQHTKETGQKFLPEVFNLIWEFTQGQPWLVNALAYEVCFEMKQGRDRKKNITTEMIIQAKENIIARRDTHIDQLIDKLEEERVKNVIQPVLTGKKQLEKIPLDDIYYVRDLGLIKTEGQIRIANKIYQEIIPKELSYSTQLMINEETSWYKGIDGRLDINKLLLSFQQFFREHSEHWLERFNYKEAGPQLLLQAFLQRIINGGGRVEREYGLGRMRTDLLVIWPYGKNKSFTDKTQKIVLELKILHNSIEDTVKKGLEQTFSYIDKSGAEEGHLIIFDRTKDKNWEEKIFTRVEQYQSKKINIWGM